MILLKDFKRLILKFRVISVVIFATILFLYIFNSSSFCFTNATSWGRFWQGGTYAIGNAIAADQNGNVYVTGTSFPSLFLKKVNQTGKLEWSKVWSEYALSEGYDIAISSNCDIYVYGVFERNIEFSTDSGTITKHAESYLDYFLCKLTPQGNLVWVKSWPQVFSSDINLNPPYKKNSSSSMVLDDSGNVFVVGMTVQYPESVNTNPAYMNEYGIKETFLYSFDKNGDPIMKYYWGPTIPAGIAIENDNNIIISGYFSSTLDLNQEDSKIQLVPSRNSEAKLNDIYLFKINQSGVLNWAKTVVDNDNCVVNAIDIDLENNIYLGGQFNDNTTLMKLDENGEILWEDCWNNGEYANCKSIAVNELNNVYITGSVVREGFVKCYDKDGTELWFRSWYTDNSFNSNEITIDSNKNIYITGSYSGKPTSIWEGYSPIDPIMRDYVIYVMKVIDNQ